MSDITLPVLARQHRGDPARPFVTFYDDATGERTELSYTTFDNWVAKTANLVQDVLVATPGARIAILLPTHWQTLVWLMACWEAGVVAALGIPPMQADHVVVGPDELDQAAGCPGERVAMSLRPLGAGFAGGLPPGVLDYAIEVPAQPDAFTPHGSEPRPADAALALDGSTRTHADLVTAAAEAAADLRLTSTSRILTTADPTTWDGLRTCVLAPLAAGASVVLCRNLDRSVLDRRAAAERISHSVL